VLSLFDVGFFLARQILTLITNISPSRFVLSDKILTLTGSIFEKSCTLLNIVHNKSNNVNLMS